MRSIVVFLSCVVLAGCASAPAAPSAAVEATEPVDWEGRLDDRLDALWALTLKRYPTWATYEGVREYDDRLTDMSAAAIEGYIEDYAAIAEEVASIPTSKLSPTSQDTQRLVAQRLDQMRQSRVCKSERWSVNGLGGPQVDYAMLPVFHVVRDERDLANLEARYRAVPDQVEAIIGHLESGVESGHTPARVNVEAALRQLEKALAVPIDDDPMLTVNYADGVEPLPTDGLRTAVEEEVRPALEHYQKTLEETVLPAARAVPGVASLQDGSLCYRAKMTEHIGPGFDPEALHEEGLAQLKASHAGMMEIAGELGIDAKTPQDVMAAFAGDPANFAKTEDELLQKNRAVVERARAAMPKAFGRLPTTPVEVRALEPHRAADAPAAYYYSAPNDGSRPGIYYVNTSRPTTRPLYNLEALAFHEAIPGHHLQIALASELPDMHVWRRAQGQTAFVEGWALYAEKLADEMGLYSSPRMRFGMHNYQAWRAARLVIDTGLHHYGWSRERAVTFLSENTGLPANEVENEINRYIAWPGQALAYMVGRLTIEELRAEARGELGDRFDLVAFHDEIHRRGAVPLTLLRRHIREWIAAQQ